MGRSRKRVKPVSVVPYDGRWPDLFDLEASRLEGVFEPGAVAIHHIGSTSVEGLCAKPVIDILVETPDLTTVDDATPVLEQLGFEARGEYVIPGRRYFSRPGTSSRLKVHLHAFRSADPNASRHLRFRDYLRAHPAVVAEYCVLKRRLVTAHGDDRDSYQAGKAGFIEQRLRDAGAREVQGSASR